MAPNEVTMAERGRQSSNRVALPGFGLPVDVLPHWSRGNKEQERKRFSHAIADYFMSDGITLREIRMLEFMNQITDKPNWESKIFDEEIVGKWRKEGVRWDPNIPERGDWWLSEKMFEACVAELREKAEQFKKTGFVGIWDAEATIVKSDNAVSSELKERLKKAVKALEDVPDRLKDWHPGSDEKVLDLVHPSLFPVIFGVSRVLPSGAVPLQECAKYIGEGETTPKFSAKRYEGPGPWGNGPMLQNAWGSYQWLPANIKFTGEDRCSKIESYINNLHPARHQELYNVLEQAVDAAIPLWSECLSWECGRLRIDVQDTSNEDYEMPEGVKFPREEYRVNPLPEGQEPDPEEAEMDDQEWSWDYAADGDYEEWSEQHRILQFPEPEHIPVAEVKEKRGFRPVDLRKDFAKRGLQVIFKLANIHLTPDKPTYDAGSWHVEGSLNEHICASAIYYYDCENVTDSRLAFRQSFNTEAMCMKAAQSEYQSAEAYYGIRQEGPCTLDLGSVVTKPDRLIAFPNVIQHQVQRFRLADPTKPGHRKILAMFLVDPHISVLSTANVPPQRKDWWAEEVRKLDKFAALPREVFDFIIEAVDDFPLSWEAAEDIREKLMDERGGANDALNNFMEEDCFNFCEH